MRSPFVIEILRALFALPLLLLLAATFGIPRAASGRIGLCVRLLCVAISHLRGAGISGNSRGRECFGVEAGAVQRLDQCSNLLAQRILQRSVRRMYRHMNLPVALGDSQIDGGSLGPRDANRNFLSILRATRRCGRDRGFRGANRNRSRELDGLVNRLCEIVRERWRRHYRYRYLSWCSDLRS